MATVSRSAAAPQVHGVPAPLHGGPLALARFMREHGMLNLNYAKLIAHTQYVPVLSDMTAELDKIDPKLGANPLINPPKSTLDKVKGWAPLKDEQTQEFNTIYAAVTGG